MRAIASGLLMAAAVSLPGHAAEPDGPTNLITKTEAVRITVQGLLSGKSATGTRKAQNDALVEYYSVPDQPLLWVDENGLTERAKLAMAEIAKADDYGLRASDYSLPDAAGVTTSEQKPKNWLADAEMKVSYAVLNYANDARGGRIDPLRVSKNLDPTLALPVPSEVLASIAIRSDPGAYLRSFQPDQPQFEALRQKLLELRGGKVEEPKPLVTIPDGPVLKLGMEHEQVALLRQRLSVPAGAKPTKFDEAVLDAVRQFQSANGTAADGIVGAGTRRLLNGGQRPQEAASPARVQKILVNMERWRWLPHDLGPFYVTVNIPEFMLRVVEDGKTIHSTRVVTGKPDKQTPVISNEMQEIVFNPYWNVPNSIKNEEIAPYFGQGGGGFFGGGWDTSILQRHGLLIRYNGRDIDPDSIDWSRNDLRNFDLVQPPGPNNVLGRVKFLFPNKHDVYMHDTTQKFLFANAVRAESHGCMRVQYPEQLAELLLKHDKGWNAARVASNFDAGGDYHVALDQKIPVYITYFTMRVNDDGSLSTFNDIYGHDARMAAALNGKYVPEPIFQNEEVAANQQWAPPQGRRYRPGRNSMGTDFTRALFGF